MCVCVCVCVCVYVYIYTDSDKIDYHLLYHYEHTGFNKSH